VILMHTETANDELDCASPAKESIAAIHDAAEKAVTLGRQLMTFSQKEVLQTEVLDINSVISENQKMISRLIGEDVRVVFTPAPALLVKADRGQLGQIIINLAVNSRDAMPQGGIFELQTHRIDFYEGSPGPSPAAKPGPYVVLRVRDNGAGMDAKTRARVFEPYFTTKGVGKGTGLGLSVVYGIVDKMGGFIELESQPRRGTEFRIYLPAASETQATLPRTAELPIRGGSETVLLTEDEPALREKLGQLLAKAGYRVLVAAAGDQALQMSVENPGAIHLLLTDVVMPQMSGFRLAESLLNLRPQVKVLYMSGYPNAGDESTTRPSKRNFIQKPFTKEKLLRHIRELLDADEPRA
jgi:two-component system cell cycle sensor histidine kinase/response regulator CckA